MHLVEDDITVYDFIKVLLLYDVFQLLCFYSCFEQMIQILHRYVDLFAVSSAYVQF